MHRLDLEQKTVFCIRQNNIETILLRYYINIQLIRVVWLWILGEAFHDGVFLMGSPALYQSEIATM